MKKLIVLVCFTLFSVYGVQSQTLSPNSSISILTIGPDDELYSTFGHGAIRVTDSQNGIDQDYNYGSFDFRTSNFYVKFLRGQLPYKITSHPFQQEMEYWRYYNRKVTEQVLNLNQEERQKVYDYLNNNLKPENVEYKYKFFYDNCSTRLYDILISALGEKVKFRQDLHADSTYRQWIDRYAFQNSKSWADFGMDLAIGVPSDQKTGYKGAMFLPDNLMDAIDYAMVSRDGTTQPLLISKQIINYSDRKPTDGFMTPFVFFGFILILVSIISLWAYFKKKNLVLFDKILFTVAGIAGWFLIGLWFGTDHAVTTLNWNVIWLFPLLFPMAFLLKKDSILKISSLFFSLYVIILILFLISFYLIPQSFNLANFPIILLLLLRGFMNSSFLNKFQK